MKNFLSRKIATLVAGSLSATVILVPNFAQAGSITLRGTVIDSSGNPISGASTTTAFFLGSTQFPPVTPPINFRDTTDESGMFSAFTFVSPNNYFASLGLPSARVLINPTDSSQPFVPREFTVPRTAFGSLLEVCRPDCIFEQNATFQIATVPAASYDLGTVVFGVLGMSFMLKRQLKNLN